MELFPGEIRGIVGVSEEIKEVAKKVRLAAKYDVAVLFTGESGTGKEVFSKALHSLSSRKERPFVAINCGAIPESLAESELFGHVKGAFTSAIQTRIGTLEQVNGGTIFLDEIGNLSLVVQAKLLRFFQEGEFRRVGGNATLFSNVRVISATNSDLKKAINERRFRGDLYYRINTVEINIPPLRERKIDIPVLFEHLSEKISKKLEISKEKLNGEASEAVAKSWDGNVRELEHYIEQALIFNSEN